MLGIWLAAYHESKLSLVAILFHHLLRGNDFLALYLQKIDKYFLGCLVLGTSTTGNLRVTGPG